LDAGEDVYLEEVDAVFMRKDPPFDMDYIFSTYILDLLGQRTLVVNDPVGLKMANEKMYALLFPDLIPRTMVTREQLHLKAFLDELGGEMIIKPWDGNGGRGVLLLSRKDRNLNSLLEMATDDGRRYVIAQQYVPEVRNGDKRIILVDGEPRGAILRVPAEDDHRGNMHVGARVQKTALSARDREICAAIGPTLRRDGLLFVGIDVIGDYLTEINVTSPTGIQEINALDGVRIDAEIIDLVEGHVRKGTRKLKS
jgi:glutathione synthase